MPDITNDTKPATDYVDYFTRQLPLDLARMSSLRDELEKRQGAISAVEDTLRDRARAAAEYSQAKADAAKILEGADEKIKAIVADRVKLDNDKAAFVADVDAREKALAQREKSVEVRELRVANNETALAKEKTLLDQAQAKLASDNAVLDARIKTFQEKVAKLTA